MQVYIRDWSLKSQYQIVQAKRMVNEAFDKRGIHLTLVKCFSFSFDGPFLIMSIICMRFSIVK